LRNGIASNYIASSQQGKKITTVKRQYLEWKKVFACYSFGEGLISTIYEELKSSKEPINRQII
jgi:hypothetical protein